MRNPTKRPFSMHHKDSYNNNMVWKWEGISKKFTSIETKRYVKVVVWKKQLRSNPQSKYRVEMKNGECTYPVSLSKHRNFLRDGK